METQFMVDSIAAHTAKNLADFACLIEVEDYAVYRKWFYGTFFYGPHETPCYRKSKSLSDKGYIVTAWDNGEMFKTPAERNRACVLDASRHARYDRSRGEVLRIANDPLYWASKACFRDILMGTIVEEKHAEA